MSTLKTVILSVSISTVISLGAAFFAFKKAVEMPVKLPITIFDVGAYVKAVDLNDPNYQLQSKLYAEMAKIQVEGLKSQGFIVLDASNVVTAPEEYYATGNIKPTK
jgi:predicted membrane-bound spermidine synthase